MSLLTTTTMAADGGERLFANLEANGTAEAATGQYQSHDSHLAVSFAA
jgi:hypothetical protein